MYYVLVCCVLSRMVETLVRNMDFWGPIRGQRGAHEGPMGGPWWIGAHGGPSC